MLHELVLAQSQMLLSTLTPAVFLAFLFIRFISFAGLWIWLKHLLKEHFAVALSLHGFESQRCEFTKPEDAWID